MITKFTKEVFWEMKQNATSMEFYKKLFDSKLKSNDLGKEKKRNLFTFTKYSGSMGDLCFYLNYGVDIYRSGYRINRTKAC